MKKITWHPIDLELVEEHIEAGGPSIARMIDTAKGRAAALSPVLGRARMQAGCLAVARAQSGELCQALRNAAEAAVAIFALADGSADVEVQLGGTPARLPATGITDATDVGHWRVGCWLAYILRERAAVDRLMATPVSILRGSSTRGDECQYLFAEAIQAFAKRAPDWSAKLRAALDATDPEQVQLQGEEFVLNLLVPEIELLFRLALGESGPFNETLQFALERHKKFWGKEKRKRDPDGYLALGPLAIAGMAYDAGMPIEVESDYLPRRLLEGGCRRH